MTLRELEELVHDTLYCRRMVRHGCFVHNAAAVELREQSADALPLIEQVLKSQVFPKIGLSNSPRARRKEDEQFPGLGELLGAYMRIGAKHDAARMVSFLRSMPPRAQGLAIGMIPIEFRKAKCWPGEKPYNDQKPIPPDELLAFVREALQSQDKKLRDTAAWTLSFYQNMFAVSRVIKLDAGGYLGVGSPVHSGDFERCNIDLKDMPISNELKAALRNWEEWNTRADARIGTPLPRFTPEELEAFDAEGRRLWKALQAELGPKYQVVYYSERDRKLYKELPPS
ncbi:MAG: hypothetical protein QXS54_12435 [Candidatus Methanomethylicaceae archaeon]